MRLTHRLRGGRAEASNLVACCQRCEVAKGLATLAEYREIFGRMLRFLGRLGAGETVLFHGEGGRAQWPAVVLPPGRPRRAREEGVACRCGRWIPVSRLESHLKICR